MKIANIAALALIALGLFAATSSFALPLPKSVPMPILPGGH